MSFRQSKPLKIDLEMEQSKPICLTQIRTVCFTLESWTFYQIEK